MGQLTNASLFELTDFRDYIRGWAKSRGRGEFRNISAALGIHTTLVSQVLNGRKCLTEEQAAGLCAYMRLNLGETDYFLKLVQIERAGSETLKSTFRRHLAALRAQALEIKSRVPPTTELTENDRAIYYSSWQHCVVRLLTGIEKYQTTTAIAQQLNLPVSRIQEILDFLTSRNLCDLHRSRYTRTAKNTHIEAQSSFAIRHHQNWRLKAMELQEKSRVNDLSFTAPVSLAKKDIPKVRAILLAAISEISKLIEASSSEELCYLGIDWLKI